MVPNEVHDDIGAAPQADFGTGAGAGDAVTGAGTGADEDAGALPGAPPPDAEVIDAGTGITSGDNISLAPPSLQCMRRRATSSTAAYRGRMEAVVTEFEITDIDDAGGEVGEIARKVAVGIE